MYKYGILLIITSALSAMEQPSEGKQEVSYLPSAQALSFDGLKKVLLPKTKNASSEDLYRAAACAAYISFLQQDPKQAWLQGALCGQVVPGVDELAIFSTSENRFPEPLARAAHADVGIFLDLVRGSRLFIGTGFGSTVKAIGYLPRDIEVSFVDAHIPRVSDDGKWVFCWGDRGGLYLIPTESFYSKMEISPLIGTENWRSDECDFSFINDSEFVLYNGEAVFRGTAAEVYKDGVSKLSKIIDLQKLDKKIHTGNNSVLHVFAGGALLAFKNTTSVLATKTQVTLYDLSSKTGMAPVFKKLSLPAVKSLISIHTAYDAMSCVLRYVDGSSDLISIDTDWGMSATKTGLKSDYCSYSPDGTSILFYNKASKEIAISKRLQGKFDCSIFPVSDVALDLLRWDTSGIYYTSFAQRDSGVICWNHLPSLLARYKKTVAPKGDEKPSKRALFDGEESESKAHKS